jgi:predicted nucleic acid-binding protein
MQKVIISDTSCLIQLELIGELELLYKLFRCITITGTLGILINAKLSGLIPSVKPYLAKMKLTGFRLATDLEQRILQKVGEL